MLDDRLHPLILVSVGHELVERDIDALDEAFERVFVRGERFAVVTRSAIMRFPSRNVRTRIGAWANRPEILTGTERFNVGHAYVLERPLIRGTMTAIFWLWDPPNPQHAAATYEDAIEWALSRLIETQTIDLARADSLRRAALSASA